jgi:hypothetical protein
MAGLTWVNQVGSVEGMNQAAPGTLIPDTFVRWSQDVLFDAAGLMRRRGPFKHLNLYNDNPDTGIADVFDFTKASSRDEYTLGVFSTDTPNGEERVGFLVSAVSAAHGIYKSFLRVFDKDLVFVGEEALPFFIPPLSVVSAKAALGGGIWISVSNEYTDSDTHYQFFWRGGAGRIMSNITGNFTAVSLPSASVVGTFTTGHSCYDKSIGLSDSHNVNEGMFVYAHIENKYHYVGVVKKVSDTSVELENHPFMWDAGKTTNANTVLTSTPVSLVFIGCRPYEHMHGRGLVSTKTDTPDISSGDEGTSAEGHWSAAGVTGAGLYRASDNVFLGNVKTVDSNVRALLEGSPGIANDGEEYIMKHLVNTNITSNGYYRVSNRYANSFAGLYTAVYAGLQWYGSFGNDDKNTNRVVFSAMHNPEAVDLSADAADSIIFPGKSQFRGLGASNAGLLVFLQDRTYILRGNDRTNFSVELLVRDGCLCPTSIVEAGGGVFWASKAGIMYYDGASVRNLTKDNLGLYYTDSLDSFDVDKDRIFGTMYKDNLIMHYTSWESPFQPARYEPIYAADWQNTDGIKDRTWEEFDPDFEYDDFFTENNTPIFWDRSVLNNPEESAAFGRGIKWKADANSPVLPDQGKWALGKNIQKWGPLRKNTSITFSIYLPTNAITTLSNMDFRGATSLEAKYGLKTLLGVNSVESEQVLGVSHKAASGITRTLTIMNGTIAVDDKLVVSIGDERFDGEHDVKSVDQANHTVTYEIANKTYDLIIQDAKGTATKIFDTALRARIIDIRTVYDNDDYNYDDLLVEKINMPYEALITGPDFYLQTKHFTVGDPILRKWFRRILISMLLYDGAMRIDIVDDDDNDSVDINKKKHRYWEIFRETGYSWDYLTNVEFPKIVSPNRSSWSSVEDASYYWDELFVSDFNRYSKKLAWRKSSMGFRLYQLNKYKKPYSGVVTRPNRVEVQGFTIGFKPMRGGRI